VGLDLPLPGGRAFDGSVLPSYAQLHVADFHTSSLSLVALEQQTRVGNDLVAGLPKNESFDALVREQLGRLKEILRQLPGESLASLGEIRFGPGGVLDSLRAFIEAKMKQLAHQHERQGGVGDVCERFVRGACRLGATCEASHTDAALRRWVAGWAPPRVSEGALCIVETLGREALTYVCQHLEQTLQVHAFRMHALERHSFRVVCKKVAAGAAAHVTLLDLSHTFKPGTLPLGRAYPGGTARLASALAQNNTVEQLILDNNELGARGLLTLLRAFDGGKGNTTVRMLSVKNNAVDGDDALRIEAAGEILSRAVGIQQLSLACNPLRPSGAAALLVPIIRRNPRLCILDACGTQIGDEGAEAIADALRDVPQRPTASGPPGLLSLNLGWCRMSPTGLGYLFDALSESPGNLAELSVASNTCSSKTGSARVGDLLRANSVLTSLDLRWTYPSDESANSVLDEVSKSNHNIRILDMSHNDIVTDRRVLDLIAKKVQPSGPLSGAAERLRQKRAELADHAARGLQRVKAREERSRRNILDSTPSEPKVDTATEDRGEDSPSHSP